MEYTLQYLRIRDILLIYIILLILLWPLSEAAFYFFRSLLFLIWFLVIIERNGKKLSEIKSLYKAISWRKTGIAAIALFCFEFSMLIILSYIFLIFDGDIDKYLPDEINKTARLDYIYDYLFTCFTAPITEEIIFRGIILNRLSKKIGVNRAIITSSLIFAVLHGPVKCLGSFIFGIICSLIYLRSRNLMNTITLHVINNSFAENFPVIVSFFESPNEGADATMDIFDLYIGILLLIPSAIYLVRFIKNNWRSAMQCVSAHNLDAQS